MREMQPDEIMQDGDELAEIRSRLGPLYRLLQRKKDDLFEQWTADVHMNRDYCRGFLAVLESIPADIDTMIAMSDEIRRQQKESAELAHTVSLEGSGYGDLAS